MEIVKAEAKDEKASTVHLCKQFSCHGFSILAPKFELRQQQLDPSTCYDYTRLAPVK